MFEQLAARRIIIEKQESTLHRLFFDPISVSLSAVISAAEKRLRGGQTRLRRARLSKQA
jgi:hypothetical protein